MWQWTQAAVILPGTNIEIPAAVASEGLPPATSPVMEIDDAEGEGFERVDFLPATDDSGGGGEDDDDDFFVVQSEWEQELIEARRELERRAEIIHGLQVELRTLTMRCEQAADLHRKELVFRDRVAERKEVELTNMQRLVRQAEETGAHQTAGLEGKLRDLAKQLRTQESEALALRAEMGAALAAQKRDHEAAAAALRQQLDDRARVTGAQATELKEVTGIYEAKLLAAQQALQLHSRRAEQLAGSLAQRDADSDRLQAEAAALRAEVTSLQDVTNNLRKDHHALTQAAVVAQRDRERLDADLHRLEGVRLNLMAEVGRLGTEARRHAGETEQMAFRLTELETAASELEAQRDKDHAAIEQLKSKLQWATTDQQRVSDALAKAEALLEEKEAAFQTHTAELGRALADSAQSTASLTRRLAALEDEKVGLSAQLQEAKADYARGLQSTARALQDQLAQRTTEHRDRERALESQCNALRALTEEREGEVGAQQRAREAETAALQAHAAALQGRLEESRRTTEATEAGLRRELEAAHAQREAADRAAAAALARASEDAAAACDVLENECARLRVSVADVTQSAATQRDELKQRFKQEMDAVRAQCAANVEEVEGRLQVTIQQLQEQGKEKGRALWGNLRLVAELKDSAGAGLPLLWRSLRLMVVV